MNSRKLLWILRYDYILKCIIIKIYYLQNQLSQDIKNDFSNDADVLLFVGKKVDNAQKYIILKSPCSSYDYKADVTSGKRPSLLAWLKQYDWLWYSTVLSNIIEFGKLRIRFE